MQQPLAFCIAIAFAAGTSESAVHRGTPAIGANDCAALISILGCEHDLDAAQGLEFSPGTRVHDVCEAHCTARDRRALEERPSEHRPGPETPSEGDHDAHESGGHGEHGEEREQYGEGGEHGEEEEEHHVADVMAATLVGLIVVTIGFETMHEALDEAAGERMQDVVDAMFGELTVLGFIGLLTFISIRTEAAHWVGEHLFPEEPDEFVEILEDLHMLLFFVMVVFISEVVYLIQSGRSNIARWRDCEDAIENHDRYYEHSKEFYTRGHNVHHTHVGTHLFYQRKEQADARRIVEFDWLKARFLQQANKKQDRLELGGNFDLAAYFAGHQHKIFEQLIDIKNSTWVMVICFVPLLRLAMYLPSHLAPRAFAAFGWLLFICSVIIRLDMRKILVLLSPRPHHAPELGIQLSSDLGHDLSSGLMSQAGGSSNSKPASQFQQHKPICTHEALHRTESIKELVPHYKRIKHSHGHLKGQRKKHDHLFWHPAYHFVCCRPLHERVAGHQVTLQFISLLMLLTAAYVAVFAKQIGVWLEEMHGNDEGGNSSISFVIIALLPIPLAAIQFPHMCVDYVMASGIEDLISEEELHRTVLNQRAAAIVKLLKMLALARKQKLMLGSLLDEQSADGGESLTGSESAPELPEHFKHEIEELWRQYDQDGSGMVDLGEFKAIVSEVSQAQWHDAELTKMFSIVDRDSSGEISKEEFQGFMAAHLQPSDVEKDAKMLFELIDVQHGGQVSASEFRAFLCGWWTGHLPDRPDENFTFPPTILDDAEVETLVAQGHGGTAQAKVRHAYMTGTVRLEPGADVVITDRPPPRAEMTEDEIDEIVKLADKGGDGVIQVEEFCAFVKEYTKG